MATIQEIRDQVQTDIRDKAKPDPDPEKVSAADTADILDNTLAVLETLGTPGASNFTPYAEDAQNSPGDFVEFEGEIWKYVGVTPTTGQSPAESPELWEVTNSGALAHAQNTDTHTNSGTFEIGKTAGAVDQPTGATVLILAGPHGESKGAIRYFWQMEGMEKVFHLQKTLHYTGTGSDVWTEWADQAALDALAAIVSGHTTSIASNTTAITANTTALDTKAGKDIPINTRTANYTLALSDSGGMVRMNMATANTITVPPDSSVAWGTAQIVISQAGIGQTTIQGGVGVTVNSYGAKFKTAGQYAGATLVRVGANTWTLYGTLVN